MSDPTPIKALDWHGFLRILAALQAELDRRDTAQTGCE